MIKLWLGQLRTRTRSVWNYSLINNSAFTTSMSKKDERKRVLPWLACVGRETQLESFDFTNRMKNRCYKAGIFFFFGKEKELKKKRNTWACKKICHCYCGEEDHPNLRTRGMFLFFNKTKVYNELNLELQKEELT